MSQQHSEEQLAEFKEAFSLFDKDNDGTIKLCDLSTALRSLGMDKTQDEIQEALKKVSHNTQEIIDYQTFISLISVAQKAREVEEKEVIDAFRAVDKEGTGYLAPNEFIQVFKGFGENLSEDDMSEIWQIDDDGYGNIDYVKFVKMMFM